MRKTLIFISTIIMIGIAIYFFTFLGSGFLQKDDSGDRQAVFQPSGATLPDLDDYPIIDDCRKTPVGLGRSLIENDNGSPLDYIVKHITDSAEMYKIMQLKPGYTLGRVRVRGVALPGEELCYSYFRLGIRDDNSGVVLKDNAEILSALNVTEENLHYVGKLLYGDPNTQQYQEMYAKWSKGGDCMKPILGKCKKVSDWPKNIEDGDILRASDGSTTLHRFKDVGRGVLILQHYQITLQPNGTTSLDSETLAQFDTGIMY